MSVKMHIVKNNLISAVISVSQVTILLVYLHKERVMSKCQSSS